ncbi:hypothetical protein KIPB_001424 [Kipferlia bialata]|uniref:Uncharacterized protein n=1 Tax=Kipferlia bialata TaxID=797122 RepID=A0A9K3CNP8_9EUKA|nr:hypothetical protein KIPB_001424 [Kipferlia bialata]|eukprot:g1424.t1
MRLWAKPGLCEHLKQRGVLATCLIESDSVSSVRKAIAKEPTVIVLDYGAQGFVTNSAPPKKGKANRKGKREKGKKEKQHEMMWKMLAKYSMPVHAYVVLEDEMASHAVGAETYCQNLVRVMTELYLDEIDLGSMYTRETIEYAFSYVGGQQKNDAIDSVMRSIPARYQGLLTSVALRKRMESKAAVYREVDCMHNRTDGTHAPVPAPVVPPKSSTQEAPVVVEAEAEDVETETERAESSPEAEAKTPQPKVGVVPPGGKGSDTLEGRIHGALSRARTGRVQRHDGTDPIKKAATLYRWAKRSEVRFSSNETGHVMALLDVLTERDPAALASFLASPCRPVILVVDTDWEAEALLDKIPMAHSSSFVRFDINSTPADVGNQLTCGARAFVVSQTIVEQEPDLMEDVLLVVFGACNDSKSVEWGGFMCFHLPRLSTAVVRVLSAVGREAPDCIRHVAMSWPVGCPTTEYYSMPCGVLESVGTPVDRPPVQDPRMRQLMEDADEKNSVGGRCPTGKRLLDLAEAYSEGAHPCNRWETSSFQTAYSSEDPAPHMAVIISYLMGKIQSLPNDLPLTIVVLSDQHDVANAQFIGDNRETLRVRSYDQLSTHLQHKRWAKVASCSVALVSADRFTVDVRERWQFDLTMCTKTAISNPLKSAAARTFGGVLFFDVEKLNINVLDPVLSLMERQSRHNPQIAICREVPHKLFVTRQPEPGQALDNATRERLSPDSDRTAAEWDFVSVNTDPHTPWSVPGITAPTYLSGETLRDMLFRWLQVGTTTVPQMYPFRGVTVPLNTTYVVYVPDICSAKWVTGLAEALRALGYKALAAAEAKSPNQLKKQMLAQCKDPLAPLSIVIMTHSMLGGDKAGKGRRLSSTVWRVLGSKGVAAHAIYAVRDLTYTRRTTSPMPFEEYGIDPGPIPPSALTVEDVDDLAFHQGNVANLQADIGDFYTKQVPELILEASDPYSREGEATGGSLHIVPKDYSHILRGLGPEPAQDDPLSMILKLAGCESNLSDESTEMIDVARRMLSTSADAPLQKDVVQMLQEALALKDGKASVEQEAATTTESKPTPVVDVVVTPSAPEAPAQPSAPTDATPTVPTTETGDDAVSAGEAEGAVVVSSAEAEVVETEPVKRLVLPAHIPDPTGDSVCFCLPGHPPHKEVMAVISSNETGPHPHMEHILKAIGPNPGVLPDRMPVTLMIVPNTREALIAQYVCERFVPVWDVTKDSSPAAIVVPADLPPSSLRVHLWNALRHTFYDLGFGSVFVFQARRVPVFFWAVAMPAISARFTADSFYAGGPKDRVQDIRERCLRDAEGAKDLDNLLPKSYRGKAKGLFRPMVGGLGMDLHMMLETRASISLDRAQVAALVLHHSCIRHAVTHIPPCIETLSVPEGHVYLILLGGDAFDEAPALAKWLMSRGVKTLSLSAFKKAKDVTKSKSVPTTGVFLANHTAVLNRGNKKANILVTLMQRLAADPSRVLTVMWGSHQTVNKAEQKMSKQLAQLYVDAYLRGMSRTRALDIVETGGSLCWMPEAVDLKTLTNTDRMWDEVRQALGVPKPGQRKPTRSSPPSCAEASKRITDPKMLAAVREQVRADMMAAKELPPDAASGESLAFTSLQEVDPPIHPPCISSMLSLFAGNGPTLSGNSHVLLLVATGQEMVDSLTAEWPDIIRYWDASKLAPNPGDLIERPTSIIAVRSDLPEEEVYRSTWAAFESIHKHRMSYGGAVIMRDVHLAERPIWVALTAFPRQLWGIDALSCGYLMEKRGIIEDVKNKVRHALLRVGTLIDLDAKGALPSIRPSAMVDGDTHLIRVRECDMVAETSSKVPLDRDRFVTLCRHQCMIHRAMDSVPNTLTSLVMPANTVYMVFLGGAAQQEVHMFEGTLRAKGVGIVRVESLTSPGILGQTDFIRGTDVFVASHESVSPSYTPFLGNTLLATLLTALSADSRELGCVWGDATGPSPSSEATTPNGVHPLTHLLATHYIANLTPERVSAVFAAGNTVRTATPFPSSLEASWGKLCQGTLLQTQRSQSTSSVPASAVDSVEVIVADSEGQDMAVNEILLLKASSDVPALDRMFRYINGDTSTLPDADTTVLIVVDTHAAAEALARRCPLLVPAPDVSVHMRPSGVIFNNTTHPDAMRVLMQRVIQLCRMDDAPNYTPSGSGTYGGLLILDTVPPCDRFFDMLGGAVGKCRESQAMLYVSLSPLGAELYPYADMVIRSCLKLMRDSESGPAYPLETNADALARGVRKGYYGSMTDRVGCLLERRPSLTLNAIEYASLCTFHILTPNGMKALPKTLSSISMEPGCVYLTLFGGEVEASASHFTGYLLDRGVKCRALSSFRRTKDILNTNPVAGTDMFFAGVDAVTQKGTKRAQLLRALMNRLSKDKRTLRVFVSCGNMVALGTGQWIRPIASLLATEYLTHIPKPRAQSICHHRDTFYMLPEVASEATARCMWSTVCELLGFEDSYQPITPGDDTTPETPDAPFSASTHAVLTDPTQTLFVHGAIPYITAVSDVLRGDRVPASLASDQPPLLVVVPTIAHVILACAITPRFVTAHSLSACFKENRTLPETPAAIIIEQHAGRVGVLVRSALSYLARTGTTCGGVLGFHATFIPAPVLLWHLNLGTTKAHKVVFRRQLCLAGSSIQTVRGVMADSLAAVEEGVAADLKAHPTVCHVTPEEVMGDGVIPSGSTVSVSMPEAQTPAPAPVVGGTKPGNVPVTPDTALNALLGRPQDDRPVLVARSLCTLLYRLNFASLEGSLAQRWFTRKNLRVSVPEGRCFLVVVPARSKRDMMSLLMAFNGMGPSVAIIGTAPGIRRRALRHDPAQLAKAQICLVYEGLFSSTRRSDLDERRALWKALSGPGLSLSVIGVSDMAVSNQEQVQANTAALLSSVVRDYLVEVPADRLEALLASNPLSLVGEGIDTYTSTDSVWETVVNLVRHFKSGADSNAQTGVPPKNPGAKPPLKPRVVKALEGRALEARPKERRRYIMPAQFSHALSQVKRYTSHPVNKRGRHKLTDKGCMDQALDNLPAPNPYQTIVVYFEDSDAAHMQALAASLTERHLPTLYLGSVSCPEELDFRLVPPPAVILATFSALAEAPVHRTKKGISLRQYMHSTLGHIGWDLQAYYVRKDAPDKTRGARPNADDFASFLNHYWREYVVALPPEVKAALHKGPPCMFGSVPSDTAILHRMWTVNCTHGKGGGEGGDVIISLQPGAVPVSSGALESVVSTVLGVEAEGGMETPVPAVESQTVSAGAPEVEVEATEAQASALKAEAKAEEAHQRRCDRVMAQHLLTGYSLTLPANLAFEVKFNNPFEGVETGQRVRARNAHTSRDPTTPSPSSASTRSGGHDDVPQVVLRTLHTMDTPRFKTLLRGIEKRGTFQTGGAECFADWTETYCLPEGVSTYVVCMPLEDERWSSRFCRTLNAKGLSCIRLSRCKTVSRLRRALKARPEVVVVPYSHASAPEGSMRRRLVLEFARYLAKRRMRAELFFCQFGAHIGQGVHSPGAGALMATYHVFLERYLASRPLQEVLAWALCPGERHLSPTLPESLAACILEEVSTMLCTHSINTGPELYQKILLVSPRVPVSVSVIKGPPDLKGKDSAYGPGGSLIVPLKCPQPTPATMPSRERLREYLADHYRQFH